jgi:hypothetical protein
MDSFLFLALPPELRVMVYAYIGPPIITNTPEYCGLRQTCRLIRNEYDNEALRALRRAYQRAKLGYSFTLFSPDLRSLEVKFQYDAAQPLPDFRSFNLILWDLKWLWKVTIVYEPCGNKRTDDFAVISTCQAIGRSIAQVPRPPSTRTAGLERYIDRVVVLRQILFKWGEEDLGAVEVNKLSSWWKAVVRGNAVSFDIIQHHDENDVLIGYEWRRCQIRDKAIVEIWKLGFMVLLHLVVLTVAFLSSPDLARSWMMQAYFVAFPPVVALTAVFSPVILLVMWRILSSY